MPQREKSTNGKKMVSWTATLPGGVHKLPPWGRLLDPIADKFLVISGLILLVQFQRVAAWLAIAMIVREIGVTGIRAIAATDGIIVPAGTLGKYKVVLQVVAILLLTLQEAIFLTFF